MEVFHGLLDTGGLPEGAFRPQWLGGWRTPEISVDLTMVGQQKYGSRPALFGGAALLHYWMLTRGQGVRKGVCCHWMDSSGADAANVPNPYSLTPGAMLLLGGL